MPLSSTVLTVPGSVLWLAGRKLTCGPVPTPKMFPTAIELPEASERTTAPMRRPVYFGAKVAFTVQLSPEEKVKPAVQVPPAATAKSKPEAPSASAETEAMVPLLGSVKVSVTGELLIWPTATVPKFEGLMI